MSSIINNRISISLFGESESNALGITIENLPSGEYIDLEELQKFMARRFPKSCSQNYLENSKKKPAPRIISGLVNGRTTGGSLCVLLKNTDLKVAKKTSEIPQNTRIGLADYTGALRYRGFNDIKDLDKFTDRITSPICFAGAICGQILERRGIYVGSHISQLHNIKDNPFDYIRAKRDAVISVRSKDFPVINDRKGWLMIDDMNKAFEFDEALGGIIECIAINIPAGIGSPVFNGLQNSIAQLIFSIPCVSGLEFGAGFSATKMIESQNYDEFYIDEHGHAVTKTNNHGGIIGGISSGMPITLKVAFKPMKIEKITSSIVPSAVPCVESAVNIALLSHMIDYPDFC